jgi:hypothetical protein
MYTPHAEKSSKKPDILSKTIQKRTQAEFHRIASLPPSGFLFLANMRQNDNKSR